MRCRRINYKLTITNYECRDAWFCRDNGTALSHRDVELLHIYFS
jgi:hypothetical protein